MKKNAKNVPRTIHLHNENIVVLELSTTELSSHNIAW